MIYKYRVTALILCIAVGNAARAADFCVSNATELETALSTALGNGQPDEIRLVSGQYAGNFAYSSGVVVDGVSLRGGYDGGCANQVGAPTDTVLDAGGVSRALDLDVTNTTPADFTLENLTVDSGYRDVIGINDGGGVYIRTAGNVTVSRVHFTDNQTVAGRGGALYVDSAASVTVERSLFYRNEAGGRGGALRLFNAANATVAGNVFVDNVASSDGGAIAFDQDANTLGDAIVNNTFYLNDGVSGGAIYAVLDSESAGMALENNVFHAGVATTAADIYLDNDPDNDNVVSPATVLGNAWENQSNSFWKKAPSQVADNLQVKDPMFTDPVALDLIPRTTSPLVDRGVMPSVALAASDLAGVAREQGPAIDIGAYETALFGGAIATAAGGDDLGLSFWRTVDQSNRTLWIDGATGAPVFDRQLGGPGLSAKLLVSLPDLNMDGAPEFALVGYDLGMAQVQALVRDGATGTFVRKILYSADYHPLDAVVLAGVSGPGTWGLGVHGVNPDGRQRVQVKDISSGALVANVDFSAKYTPFAAAAIADYNGNGVDDILVLSTQEGGRSLVQIKDGLTRDPLRRMYFSAAYRPVDFGVVPDVDGGSEPEVALLGVRASDGDVRLLLKDSVTSVLVRNRKFDSAYQPIAYVYVPDAGASAGIGVLGRLADGSAVRLTLQDAVSGAFLRHMTFDPAYTPRAITVIGDADGSGADEIAVLGFDGAGQAHIQVKDASSAANLIKSEIP